MPNRTRGGPSRKVVLFAQAQNLKAYSSNPTSERFLRPISQNRYLNRSPNPVSQRFSIRRGSLRRGGCDQIRRRLPERRVMVAIRRFRIKDNRPAAATKPHINTKNVWRGYTNGRESSPFLQKIPNACLLAAD